MNFDRMRSLLLEQAVRGMLVSQRDDEPAVKQIGKVPDDVPFLIPEKWKWIAAQDAYELLSGRDLQKGEILNVEPEAPSIPYITGASQIIDSRVLITRWTQNCSVKSVKGDLLLTCKGTVGKTAFNTVGDMHIARQIMALRAKPEIVEGKFLRLFIDSIAETLAKNAKSMIPGIDRKTLLKNSIPIPPLKEQRRIVAKLEESFAEIDRAEKAYRELQTLASVLRGKILQEAVMGKLVPQLDGEPAVEQIGEAPEDVLFAIPEKWKWVRLSAVGEIVGGGTPKTGVSEYWDGDISWITPADLGKNSDQTIYSGAKLITQKGLDKSSAKLMPKGSIVYSSRAPIGHIAVAGKELCTNQGCKSFVPDTKFISTEWAYYILIARTGDIQSRASGTTFKEISGKGMGETWISLPPLPEQRRIVAKVEELMAQVDRLAT
ncbi:restriction endonuclease subunit S [Sutterella wadsworthensis]|jgi:type I restriction-modification system, S subunit|uniref:restriction endonuclease subunit S n=1 Tax=Sutterella wadsworthensis TaxID=40545 RepID=UPI00241FB237|nr:restriction endonuclease subunit S [Sutterella wadsworthensis]